MAHTLQFIEYAHTDLAKASSIATLDLNDETNISTRSFIPVSGVADPLTGEYADVWDTIVVKLGPALGDVTPDNVANQFSNLNLWARKCILYDAAGGIGNEVWLKWQHENATNAVYVRVKRITAQLSGNGGFCEIRVLREGLWHGAYQQAYISNMWTARTNSAAITLQNHFDRLTHVYDYNNNGAASPYVGGTFGATNKPNYLLDNAAGTGASKISEVGDGVYFGNMDAAFYSMILRVTTAAVYNATLVWEYWDGSAWTSFTPTDPSNKLTTTGTHTITWGALAGWAKATHNSVSAYWIRLRCSAFTSSTNSAVLASGGITYFGMNQLYLCDHANYVKVAAADVDGDAPALAQIMVQSKATAAAVVRVAKRSIGTVDTATNMFAVTTGTANSNSWGGQYANHAAPNSTWTDGSLSLTLNTHNYGLWQVLVRQYSATAAATAEWRLRAKLGTSNASYYAPENAFSPDVADQWCIVDLGPLPVYPVRGNSPTNIVVYPQYRRSSGTDAMREDALILLPTDEFYHVVEVAANNTAYYVVLSGLDGQVYVGSAASGATVYENAEPMGMPLTLEPNRDNYFFFLCDQASDVNNNTDTVDVVVKYIPRYISMRGTNA